MVLRLLGLTLLATACTPAMTMQRLRPPKAVLGTARTVHVLVKPAPTDTVPGEPEPVSEKLRRSLTARLTAIGYSVCPALPCGDGVLEVVLSEVAFGELPPQPETPEMLQMKIAMQMALAQAGFTNSTSTSSGPQVSGQLNARITLTQSDGKVGFRRSFSQRLSAQKPVNVVAQETIDAVVKSLEEVLARQTPLVRVTLEVGGPLNPGVELLHKADWAGAVAHFTELTRTQPELDGAWYDLGVALEAQGAWVQAAEAYRNAHQRAKKPHYSNAASATAALVRVPAN